MYTGGAGGYSFYVRKGEQVIRQRKNNSNYGSGASRTYAQMIRRIKWGNLVNVFKAMKSWQPKAYDSKKQGQTDYNIFMQLNINKATAALTREMCISGCAVIEPCQVSRGSLPPIALALAGSGNQYVSDIKISNAIQGSTTVGQLTTDILANNPQFQEGDNLAFCAFYNWKDSRVEWPFVSTRYTEITLDSASTVVVNSIPLLDNRLSKSTGGFLQASWSAGTVTSPNNEVGMVLIHTRKSASTLAVSSQEIVMNANSIVAEFSGNTWYQTCIDTYGLSTEVPLDPSFPEASIQSVTANGSAVLNASVLSGSQFLDVQTNKADSEGVVLYKDNVRLTPLDSSDYHLNYILNDNGNYRLFSGGRLFMSFVVQDCVVPADLPSRWSVGQRNTQNQDAINAITGFSTFVNYPQMYNESHPNFTLVIGVEDNPFVHTDSEDYTVHNCSIDVRTTTSGYSTMIVANVVDADKVAWVEYEGFILFVFNYN